MELTKCRSCDASRHQPAGRVDYWALLASSTIFVILLLRLNYWFLGLFILNCSVEAELLLLLCIEW